MFSEESNLANVGFGIGASFVSQKLIEKTKVLGFCMKSTLALTNTVQSKMWLFKFLNYLAKKTLFC